MGAGVEICLLGPLQVRCDGVVVAVRAGKQRALLAALLLQAGRVVPAGQLPGYHHVPPFARGTDVRLWLAVPVCGPAARVYAVSMRSVPAPGQER
jgi:hypothetical protein